MFFETKKNAITSLQGTDGSYNPGVVLWTGRDHRDDRDEGQSADDARSIQPHLAIGCHTCGQSVGAQPSDLLAKKKIAKKEMKPKMVKNE